MFLFIHGPAHLKVLELRRAPLLLRVTHDGSGGWDALDQLDDEPGPKESIHVYRLLAPPSGGFIDFTNKKGRREGRRILMARYGHHTEQPPDAVLRDTPAWRAWATEAHAAFFAAIAAKGEGVPA